MPGRVCRRCSARSSRAPSDLWPPNGWPVWPGTTQNMVLIHPHTLQSSWANSYPVIFLVIWQWRTRFVVSKKNCHKCFLCFVLIASHKPEQTTAYTARFFAVAFALLMPLVFTSAIGCPQFRTCHCNVWWPESLEGRENEKLTEWVMLGASGVFWTLIEDHANVSAISRLAAAGNRSLTCITVHPIEDLVSQFGPEEIEKNLKWMVQSPLWHGKKQRQTYHGPRVLPPLQGFRLALADSEVVNFPMPRRKMKLLTSNLKLIFRRFPSGPAVLFFGGRMDTDL